MAILKAPTFYIDHVLGNDAARATLTNAVASNPTGTTTRITYAGHGLITGACVTLSSFTSWLNGVFIITKISNDAFDLDDTNWQSTADPIGNVVPHGGSSWNDSWASPSGATAARLTVSANVLPVIKIRKTPDPIYIDDLLWTIGDNTYINLPAGETIDVCMCETVWTANPTGDTTVTLTPVATDAKQGSNCIRFLTDSSAQLDKLQAHFTIDSINLSAYQQLSFWLKGGSLNVYGIFKIALCSDTSGTIIVDEFILPSMGAQWFPVTLSRVGGGNLGNNINSIAIYTTGINANSKYFFLDNIIASKENRISLNTIISMSNEPQTSKDNFIAQSIENNVLRLGSFLSLKPNINIPVATYLVTGTYTTYIRNSGIDSVLTTAGTADWQGGYDIATDTQNGQTIFYGNGANNVITINKANTKMNWIGVAFANYGFSLAADDITIQNIGIITGSQGRGFYFTKNNCSIDKIYSASNQSGDINGINNKINIIYNQNDGYYYINATNMLINYMERAGSMSIAGAYNRIIKIDNLIAFNSGYGRFLNAINCSIEYLGSAISNAGFTFQSSYNCKVFCGGEWLATGSNPGLINCAALSFDCYIANYIRPIGQLGTISVTDATDSYFSLFNKDGVEHNNYIFAYDAVANYQTDIKHGLDPGAWRVEIEGLRNPIRSYPFRMKLAEIGFIKDIPVVFKVWLKKTPHISVFPETVLIIPANIAVGNNTELSLLSADNEEWQQLSLSFTPIVDGITDVFFTMNKRGIAYVGSILTYQAI